MGRLVLVDQWGEGEEREEGREEEGGGRCLRGRHCGSREHRRKRSRCSEGVGQFSFRHIDTSFCVASVHLATRIRGLWCRRVVVV